MRPQRNANRLAEPVSQPISFALAEPCANGEPYGDARAHRDARADVDPQAHGHPQAVQAMVVQVTVAIGLA